MSRARALSAALAVVVLAACAPCDLAKTTGAAVDTIIGPAMTVVMPVLGPQLQERYNVLRGAFDLARKALAGVCKDGDDGRQRALAATAAAIDLVEFFRDVTSREVAETAFRSRGLAMPRGLDDAGPALARAAGAKPKDIDLAALLHDLRAARAELAGR